MGYEYLRNEAIIRSKTREFFGVGTVVTASAYLVSVVDFMPVSYTHLTLPTTPYV